MNRFCVLFVLALSSFAFGSGDHKGTDQHGHHHHDCPGLIDRAVKLVPSGREAPEEYGLLQKAAWELFRDGGVFDQLGIAKPFQEIRFLPGGDLNILGTINTFPVSHWKDGAQAANASRKSGLLYEIVISGKDEQVSFYRDDNSFEAQFSILLHAAAGHNHFSHTTRYPHARSSNRIQESYSLSRKMDEYRIKYGPKEVSDWYQYLLSLTWAQDVLNARYQTPEDLVAEHNEGPGRTTFEIPETANILQAFVANFDSSVPEWKRDMARRFELQQRYIPGAIRTKIMNEGYATLMQIILPKHTSYDTFEDRVRYCCLLSGVTRPGLSNPYWLGVEAWKLIYAKFQERPEIKGRPMVERDREFIKYAKEQILQVMDDAEFLRLGLDVNWVAENHFALIQPREQWDLERDGMPPDPRDPNKNYPYVITSRDPKLVVESIIAEQKGFQYQFPKVILESMNYEGSGAVRLAVKDTIGRSVALTKSSIVETLYVMAQVVGRPVSLESTVEFAVRALPPWMDENYQRFYRQYGIPEKDWPYIVRYRPARVLVTVDGAGNVTVHEVFRNGSSDPDKWEPLPFGKDQTPTELKPAPELASLLKSMVDGFIFDLQLGDAQEEFDAIQKTPLSQALDLAVDASLEGVPSSLQISIPTLPRALIEFSNVLGRRLGAALKESIVSGGRIIRKPGGVRVRALPNIPYFRFDSASMNRYAERENSKGSAGVVMERNISSTIYEDRPMAPVTYASVKPARGGKGGIVWGPDPRQQPGSGDEEEDGEGEPSDKPGGPKPSKDGGEEQYTDVTLDAYAEALLEEIDLPNLRPKQGMSENMDFELGGRMNRMEGKSVNRPILRRAFQRGLQELDEDDEEGRSDILGLIGRGLGMLKKEQDWVVRNYDPVPDPDVNAVVFFQMDMSGSMGRFKATAKQALFDLRVMLQRKYKQVKIVYIAFNDKAYVFDDPEKFFKFEPNGGTKYDVAYRKTLELFPIYPDDQWDRFSIMVGDLDEGLDQEVRASFEEMASGTQFAATLRTNFSEESYYPELKDYLKSKAETEEFIGFADVIPEKYTPLIFRQVFKNKPK